MAHPQIAAFPRLAKENTAPSRLIAGQASRIGRQAHSIVHDPIHDEILVPNAIAQAILTFRGGANGEEPPIRMIQGPHTELTHPLRADVDPVHNEIIVPDINAILVFPREAYGDVAPIRKLYSSNWSSGTASADPLHNLIVAEGSYGRGQGRRRREGSAPDDEESEGGGTPALMIFDRTDNGNVQPRAVISGPHTGLESVRQIAVYPERGWILVSQTLYGDKLEPGKYFVGVWSINDKGDVPPRWRLLGTKSTMKRARTIALDPKHKEIIVGDMLLAALFTYYFPEIF